MYGSPVVDQTEIKESSTMRVDMPGVELSSCNSSEREGFEQFTLPNNIMLPVCTCNAVDSLVLRLQCACILK